MEIGKEILQQKVSDLHENTLLIMRTFYRKCCLFMNSISATVVWISEVVLDKFNWSKRCMKIEKVTTRHHKLIQLEIYPTGMWGWLLRQDMNFFFLINHLRSLIQVIFKSSLQRHWLKFLESQSPVTSSSVSPRVTVAYFTVSMWFPLCWYEVLPAAFTAGNTL